MTGQSYSAGNEKKRQTRIKVCVVDGGVFLVFIVAATHVHDKSRELHEIYEPPQTIN